ncbi:MAG: hypothetical protein ACFFDR_08565 [Candidatus Thorarchaeota archaeon]
MNMNSPDDNAARLTLKMAGVFQEVRDTWVRRLENYYGQLESLINGQWIESSDMIGVLREAVSASREALDGLGTDLSAELVHESRGVFGRFESERQALLEEINDLRNSLAVAISGDEGFIRKENYRLREIIMSVPEYRLLEFIRTKGRGSYNEIAELSRLKVSEVRKLSRILMNKGFITIDKKSKPHAIVFISAPWKQVQNSVDAAFDTEQLRVQQVSH